MYPLFVLMPPHLGAHGDRDCVRQHVHAAQHLLAHLRAEAHVLGARRGRGGEGAGAEVGRVGECRAAAKDGGGHAVHGEDVAVAVDVVDEVVLVRDTPRAPRSCLPGATLKTTAATPPSPFFLRVAFFAAAAAANKSGNKKELEKKSS